MRKARDPKAALIQAAADLFRRQGYAATGLNDVVKLSGAPKGSLYHYFPGGKSELGAAAIAHSGELVETTLQELAEKARSGQVLVEGYVAALCGWLETSGYRHGNPITTTLLEEAPQDLAVTAAGRRAFETWRAVLTDAFQRDGFAEPRARTLARLVLAALDGALVQARVEQSSEPLREVAAELALVLDRKS